MTTIRRRPNNSQPAAFGVTEQQAQQAKEVNSQLRYIQGFRIDLAASGTTNSDIKLNSSGRILLGLSIVPEESSDISDTQVTFMVNNNNALLKAAAENLNPNFVQGMIYFPLFQTLNGNDSLTMSFLKNDAGTATITVNIYYVPRLK